MKIIIKKKRIKIFHEKEIGRFFRTPVFQTEDWLRPTGIEKRKKKRKTIFNRFF